MESQKEELRLLAEREVARLEEEKRAQEHSRMMSEYQQSMERAMAYCNEIEAFRHAEEEKLRQVAEQEQEKRARAEIERLRGKYCLSSDSETQTPPDQLSTLLAEIERLKL